MVPKEELTNGKGAPNTPIVIVTPPTYGTAEVQTNGSIIYTPTIVNPTRVVVDAVVYSFTNLSGATVVDRKEFIVKQKGDVPRIIQTGVDENPKLPILPAALFVIVTVGLWVAFVRSLRRRDV